MLGRYIKNLAVIVLVGLTAVTIGCDKDKKDSATASASRVAFDNCVTRINARYNNQGLYYCGNVRGYYACSLNDYTSGRCSYPGSGTPIVPGQNYTVYTDNYFNSYLTQFPQQELDSLIYYWNSLN